MLILWGKSQDNTVHPDASCTSVLTLIGPNSLAMAKVYLQWPLCTVAISELVLN